MQSASEGNDEVSASALREQELTSVLESVDGRVWSVDRELRLILGNGRFRRDVLEITGRELQPGESIWNLPMPPEWRVIWQQSYERALAGETFSVEREIAGATMAYRFMPIRAADGTIRGVTVFGVDITDRIRQAQRLRVLADASRVFAEAEGDYDGLLGRVAQQTATTLRAACSIRILSGDGQWLELAASGHYDPAQQAEMEASLSSWPISIEENTPAARAARLAEPQFMPVVDRVALPESLPPERRATLERFFPHSLIVLPLRLHGRSIGSLMLARSASEPGSFDADDLSLAQDLADRAALAIGNAQLLARVQVELAERQHAQKITELLYQAGQLLARPLGQDDILNTLLDVLQQLMPIDSANIMQADSAGVFRVRYLRGYETWTDPETVKALVIDPQTMPLIGRVVATNRSILIADTSQEPDWRPVLGASHVGCWLGVPLIANATLFGIFSIDRHAPHSLTANDVRLAATLAVSAATAIERAQLIRQLRDERAELARRVDERTADLSLANAELARAARLKDEFLASMSHELRTPLNAILARAEALQEGIYGPILADQVASLQGIEESGRHLLALINDVLDVAKIESGQLELRIETIEVDLIGMLSLRMVSEIALLKRISLTSHYDSQIPLIQADERRLKQILVNLLSNAVKFTPEGGKVGLEIRGDADRESVTITVWDTGIGIAAEDLPKLFQPFVQLDSRLSRQYTGTGLGLSLVARLAKAHGGSVAVESVPGQGSRFSVTLPTGAASELTRETQESATVAVGVQAPIRQALVVEDSPAAAEQITRYLKELGANVEVLPHGTRAVERAAMLQSDIIVLDILLPDNDGWQVLRELKADARTRAIPVLVVSVVDDPAQAQRLGAAALLVKPIDRLTLEQMLRRVLARADEPLVTAVLVVAPPEGRPRILLAEDNEASIATLSDYLTAKGYEVVAARSGGEALVCAQTMLLDAILMDIQMPGMDGLEAIRRIRAERRLAQTPIIALTALAMPGDQERCLAAGASAYLAKPVSLRNLIATIEALRQRAAEPGAAS